MLFFNEIFLTLLSQKQHSFTFFLLHKMNLYVLLLTFFFVSFITNFYHHFYTFYFSQIYKLIHSRHWYLHTYKMLYILNPLSELYDEFDLNYTERLDLIKKSLCFKSSSRNTKFSYALLLLEVLATFALVYLQYSVSVNEPTAWNMKKMLFFPPSGFFIFYIPLSHGCYNLLDRENYRIRRRRDAENLNEE